MRDCPEQAADLTPHPLLSPDGSGERTASPLASSPLIPDNPCTRPPASGRLLGNVPIRVRPSSAAPARSALVGRADPTSNLLTRKACAADDLARHRLAGAAA